MCAASTENKNKADSKAALARKRRKVKRSKKNEIDDKCIEGEHEQEPDEICSTDPKKPHITGIKKHARYDPGVAMTRVQLTAWRKEARRVRNRESAAASRSRTRNKIDELESKLATMEDKYNAALKRISELESRSTKLDNKIKPVPSKQEKRVNDSDEFSPLVLLPDNTSVVSPVLSPSTSAATSPIALDLSDSSCNHQIEFGSRYQHINMISRPAWVWSKSQYWFQFCKWTKPTN